VVFLAQDPDLARPVAIKLLRIQGEHGRTRLRREAQAVAKIQHPNVIAVHEVGTHEDRVYLVMEYVDGGTLRDWVQAETRSWEEVLEVYRQAARGLMAAHRAGLVHRDFKPDNVLIGRDGRVRVTDFGIVGVSGAPEPTREDIEAAVDDVAARLTRTGAILGTPAYMPPEQYDAESADARSDQFAFCVSLYEALFGERPHEGDTVGSLLQSMQSGEVRALRETDVPPRIVDAIMKGLRPAPGERHASMAEMLAAITPETKAARWPWLVAAAGVVGVGAVTYALGGGGQTTTQPVFDCGDARAEFAASWNDERRGALEAAFAAHGKATSAAFGRVAEALDARERQWLAGVDAACEARRSGADGQAVYDLRRACLDDARRATDVFVGLLSEGKRELIDGALSSVSLLRRVERCADVDVLKSAIWPTEAQQEALAPVERDLATARLMLLAGRHHETVALGKDLEVRARAVGFDATHAAVLETLARAEMQAGLLEDAEAHAREATILAAKARDTSIETRAAGTLMFVVGPGLGRGDEALGMLPAGASAAARTHDPRARSYLKAAEGTVRGQNGDYEGAEKAVDEVIEILEGLDRPPPDELAAAYTNRAGLAVRRGDVDAGRADQRHALRIAEEGLGTQHPLYGAYALSLGINLAQAGDHEEAIEWNTAALESWEAALGPNHTSCALAVAYVGIAQLALGRIDEAGASFEDGLRRLDASEQDDPVNRLSLLDNAGQVSFRKGDFAGAESRYAAAREVVRGLGGSTDPRIARYERSIASMRQARGDDEGALKAYRTAKALLVDVYGPKHQQVAANAVFVGATLQRLERWRDAAGEYREVFRIYSDLDLPADETLIHALAGQGVCELKLGDPEASAQTLSRAAELLETQDAEPGLQAFVQLALAEGRLAAGDRDQADRLSAQAVSAYEALGPGWLRPLNTAKAWRVDAGF
jgi:tetratricopeptide (TPR) repeat protein